MRGLWIVLACLLATSGAQGMETYCRSSGISAIQDGGEYHVNWYVVSSGVRHPQLPGQEKPFPGCNFNWRSGGSMYRRPDVIQAPKLGRLQVVNNYRLYYQSARNREDALSIRIHWVQASTGKLQSAVIHYDVHVQGQPL
jgi:hypothetical protein